MVRLTGLGFSFSGKTIVQSISLDIRTGCTVLLGPAGTGKSSLLRTLAGQHDTNPSFVRWGDISLLAETPARATPPLALLVQNARLLVATVLENLQAGLPHRASLQRSEQIALIEQAANQYGQDWIMQALHTPVVQLTLCQQRIICTLHLVLQQPVVLMLDEPTTGMPDDDAKLFLGFVQRVANEIPTLIVLHHLGEARQVADHVVLMASGMVQEARSASDFFAAPRSTYANQFLQTGSCAELPKIDRPPDLDQAGAFISAYRGPRGFTWLLPGRLAGTPKPGIVHSTQSDLLALQDVGITIVVNLTEDPCDQVQLGDFFMQGYNFPIPDMEAPCIDAASHLCAQIDSWLLEPGQAVALHCKAGLGRTGTILAAYWLWRHGGHASATECVNQIRLLNKQFIQSDAQLGFLEQFAQHLRVMHLERAAPDPLSVMGNDPSLLACH